MIPSDGCDPQVMGITVNHAGLTSMPNELRSNSHEHERLRLVHSPLPKSGSVEYISFCSLWKSQIGWYLEVDIKTTQDFLKWLKEMEYLNNVQVSKWLHCDSGFQHISLHFFCDASKLAYSAFDFLRVSIGSTVQLQLIQSKTKIAPCGKKETTFAKLELLGAAISAHLSTTVLKEFPTDNVYFWTDSTTVLAWFFLLKTIIKSPCTTKYHTGLTEREEPWGVFVYNHVQDIRKLTPVKTWRRVPGSLNPADCPSRGCSAKQLCSSKWWEGPNWLHLSPQEGPISNVEVDVNEVEVNKERRAIVTSMMNVQTIDINPRNNRMIVIGSINPCSIDKIFAMTNALRRFIARGGRISVLYSDNVGTNNALRTLDWDKIVVYSTAQKITWKFIPPTEAWWDGWWERIVRMLKELLRRVLGKSIVNYEELTIVCDCELIINARPLTYIHEDPNELLPLSPAMFIHGNSNCETPDLDQVDRSSLVECTKYTCRSCVKI
ncbi:integrase catalytic domain-containing protein [Trichonephila clavipes]|uniref:Integrase catalytic domain-containing protein n=1 Tax=Trichonephila clavipes TaxID=2585209 RepID=A0A8X6R5R8_TRICX|nr:integrase catalytic domain-containing protein [Trichonephila clavipes]